VRLTEEQTREFIRQLRASLPPLTKRPGSPAALAQLEAGTERLYAERLERWKRKAGTHRPAASRSSQQPGTRSLSGR
jgi:hypothetical protein